MAVINSTPPRKTGATVEYRSKRGRVYRTQCFPGACLLFFVFYFLVLPLEEAEAAVCVSLFGIWLVQLLRLLAAPAWPAASLRHLT